MADYKPLIDIKDLKTRLFDTSFATYSHKMFIMYDEIVDEFIVKISKPSSPTSIYYLDDDHGLIFELKSKKVIGIIFFDFATQTLPKMQQINTMWYENNLAKHFRNYKELEYKPNNRKKKDTGWLLNNAESVLEEVFA